jgi:hypothetical protein
MQLHKLQSVEMELYIYIYIYIYIIFKYRQLCEFLPPLLEFEGSKKENPMSRNTIPRSGFKIFKKEKHM